MIDFFEISRAGSISFHSVSQNFSGCLEMARCRTPFKEILEGQEALVGFD